jgi:hypothetical protein
MDIAVFPPEELPFALGAVRAVEPEPTPPQDRFLEVLGRLHSQPIDPRALPTPSLDDLAGIIKDPHRRKRLLQLALVMTTIDGEVGRAPAASVARLAAALGVDERGVSTLHKLAAHHDNLARIDLLRRVGGRIFGGVYREGGIGGVGKLLAAGFGGGENPETSRRFNRLGLLPEGSFGRAIWEHWVANDFALPGQAGGLPDVAIFHDVGHVLSGYGTDPEGEIQQAAFQAGFIRNDGFMFLFFGIVQFHLGIRITPIAPAEIGYLDIEKVMTALGRGAQCTADLSDRWDFWAHAERPLAELRAELHIPPLA